MVSVEERVDKLFATKTKKTQHKLKKYKIVSSIVVLLVFFMLGVSLCIPVVQKYFSSTDIDIVPPTPNPLSDPPENWWIYPELQPREIYAAPQIDWGPFWSVFISHAVWSLEGSLDGETWYEEIPGTGINLTTDILNVGIESTGENSRKVTCDFTAIDPPGSSTSAYYRFSFAIDYRVKEYVNRSVEYEYTLTYEVNNESFVLAFNWSDYINSPLSNHSHARTGITTIGEHDYYYFRVISDHPIENDTFIELDPTYTVDSGNACDTGNTNARRVVRQSNGTLWCAFGRYNDDVVVAWSHDEGATWDNYAVESNKDSFFPSLAVDSNDVVHLVFQSYRNDINDYQLEYTNSTDWTTIVQIRDEDKEHLYPAIAVDSNDDLHVVYEKGEEGTSNDNQVAYINSMNNGGTWGTEQILTDEPDSEDDNWYPSIAIDTNNVIHLAYMVEDGVSEQDSIYHIESSDYGTSWSRWDGDLVLYTGLSETHPSLVITDDNDLMVVGRDASYDGFYRYNGSTDTGWSNGAATEEFSESCEYPVISVTDNNSAYILSEEPTSSDIQYYYNDTTSWSDEGILLVGSYKEPSLLCSQWPVIDSAKTNRPKTGFVFVVQGTANVTFHASDDLTWDAPVTKTQFDIETWNLTLSNSSSLQTLDTWNITLSNTSSLKVLDTWNLTLSNTSSLKTIDTWNITLSNTTELVTLDTWNLTLSNTTTLSTLDTWNLTLSNTSTYQILDTWNITLSNTTQLLTLDTWNITLSNTSAYTILDTWNVTLSNTAIFSSIDVWNITLSNSSTLKILDTWNITLSNTSKGVILDTWNITLSNTTQYTILDTWNITLSNTSALFTIDTWNVTLSNTTQIHTFDIWNITLSNSTSLLIIDLWNLTLSNTSIYSILDTWNLTLSNTSIGDIFDIWNITLSNTTKDIILDTWNITLSNTSKLTLSDHVPTNGSTDVCVCCIELGITAIDPEDDTLNITFYSNFSGKWDYFYTGTLGVTLANITSGTYYLDPVFFTRYNYTYYWNVSVSDGTNTVNSGIYHFTTAIEPCDTPSAIPLDAIGIIGICGLFGILGLLLNKRRKKK